MLRELILETMFEEVPKVLPRYVGEAYKVLIYEVFKESMIRVLKGRVELECNINDVKRLFSLMGSVGFPFDAIIEGNKVVIRRCPFYEKAKKNIGACVICVAMVSSLLNLCNKRETVIINNTRLGTPKADVIVEVKRDLEGGVCELCIKEKGPS